MGAPLLTDNWLGPIPWAEFISKNGSTADSSFGYESGNACGLVVKVNWSDVADAASTILGRNKYDPGTGRLIREPPLPHPKYPSLVASQVTGIKGLGFRGREVNELGFRLPTYVYGLISVKFHMPKWNRTIGNDELASLFDDTVPGNCEWERFTTLAPSGSSETLSRRAGDYVYGEGGGGTAPVANTTATDVPTPQYLYRAQKILTWWRVPAYGLLDSDTGEPANLDACVGKVNSVAWLGADVGELMMKGYRLIPDETPDIDSLILIESGKTPLMYRVELTIAKWSPPAGGATKGFGLFPWKDGLWYKLVDANTHTKLIVETADLRTMFTLPG